MELQIYYIYRTTNLINGKFYIGKHTSLSLDNDYFGSGKLILRAIKKYGVKNFKKEILEVYEFEWQMNLAERIFVVLDKEMSYNLCVGGKGGFSYIRNHPLYNEWQIKGAKIGSKFRKSHKNGTLVHYQKYGLTKAFSEAGKTAFLGKHHTEETKQKMSSSKKITSLGLRNSQFGTMWITNGIQNKKIKFIDKPPEGYYKGRII